MTKSEIIAVLDRTNDKVIIADQIAAEFEKLKSRSNRIGVEIRGEYLPKLAALQAEKDNLEKRLEIACEALVKIESLDGIYDDLGIAQDRAGKALDKIKQMEK